MPQRMIKNSNIEKNATKNTPNGVSAAHQKKSANDHNIPVKSRAQPFPAKNVDDDGSNDDEHNNNEEEVLFYHTRYNFYKTYRYSEFH